MANTHSSFSEKSLIRQLVRGRLRELSAPDRELKSKAICGELVNLLHDKRNIGLFAPTDTEPNLDFLWETTLVENRLFAYPKCEGEILRFFAVSSVTNLRAGKFGVREPDDTGAVSDLDAVVVPGLAFTKTGVRLGRGAGFYDRFLQAQPGRLLKVGVCFDFQVFPRLTQENHDKNVDLLVFA